jgi:hypothetical protein
MMNNNIILDAIDEVLSRVDSMSDEELQTKYENHQYGPVGRVFLDAETFLIFLVNESIEEYTMPINNSSIESYLCKTIETHHELIDQIKSMSVVNKDVHQLAA